MKKEFSSIYEMIKYLYETKQWKVLAEISDGLEMDFLTEKYKRREKFG